MSVIQKKDVKVQEVIALLPQNYTIDDFIKKFKAMHPEDWGRIERADNAHSKKNKPGKINPMPSANQYLVNAHNVYLKKSNSKNR